MSWEALRLTSRTPSEVYGVLGPHGVEELLHQARNAVWREYPQETRSFEAVRARTVEVFERNMKVWAAIKKPTPEAFFQNLIPQAADGHIRQALVLTWMMMPRAGGRDFKDTVKIARAIFDRMLQAWEEDNQTFTGKAAKRAKPKKTPPAKAAKSVRVAKKVGKKSSKK
jgi:hypothetical protein